MKCPKCGADCATRAVGHEALNNETYRKKKCKKCGYIFVTAEFIIEYNETFKKINAQSIIPKIPQKGLGE